ncbi:protein mono-ADP-ribosyltransferase PARP14 [Anguilla rostrata]|uniref:protein mono-ADP-ribosyltransferase PARP14 n=1 Tax=Anguilla rostrata TaxID=7938 RepID=UPI0030D61EF8
MEENILLLVGLPEDFASVKPKLELHFRNKRKSGGEVSEIRNYPNDTRKALLVYLEDEALQRVLEKGPHKVDFKALGVVELQVKSLEADDIAKVKMNPVPLPKPRFEKKIGCGKSACDIEAKPGPFHQEGLQQDGGKKVLSLLVSSDCPIKKEILQVYFEQFTDDIDICGHGDNQWILKLTSHSDLENILAKKDHVLEGSLMSVQLYDEREAEESLDPHRFILSGFSEDCKCSHLSVFIKSCSRGAEHSWEVLNDGQRIAVTFKQDIDVQAFLKKCFANKLQSMDISASRLEYTDSVLVKGNMENITEKELRDYFSSTKSNGGQIKYLIWVENAKSVLLEFEDFHVAHRVAKEKHTICGVSLCAFLFYCNLNQVLTGETPTTPPFPPKISIPVDALFLEYIQNDEECKEDFESTLKEHYTSFSFKGDPESPQVVLEMAVDRESLLLHHLAHTWERKTKQAVEGLLEKYSIVMLVSTEEVWERVKDKCLSLNLKTARVSFERAKNTIVVLGQQNDVKKLQGEIQLLLNKAKEELDVETNTVERKIPLDSKEEFGFVWNLVSEKLEGVENLKDEANLTFHLKGLEEKVNEAERIIKNTKDNLSIQTLHLSPNLAKFLQSLDLKKFERNHFTHITATVFSCGDSIQILAEKLQDGEKAREKIKEVLMEDVINLTPDQGKVTQEEHWRVFYSGLMQEVESSNNAQNVKISHSDVQIAVCGFQNVVTDVARKLREYLNNKMPVAEDIQLKSPREDEYVADCMKLSEAAEIKALDVTILSSQTQATPCLKVTAANDKIREAVAAVEKQVSHIVHEKHIYSDASKVLEKHLDALKSRAKEFACKLYPTVEQASQTGLEKGYRSPDATDTLSGPPANKSQKVAPPPPLPKPGADLKVVIGGVTLILKKGDITKEAVDAIVNSTNSSLNLDTGVSGAILKAAGKSVVDECAKLGTQKEDGVVVTGGGNLKCKHIIQMVGPTTTVGITTSAERVLQVCESKSITSMAIPAIGTGKSNINPEESIKAILKGLQKHLSQTTSTSIKFIFIVAFEQKVFDSFRHYFAERNQQSQQRTETPGPFHQEGLQQDGGEKVLSLLVSSDCPIKEEILQLYFEQFTDDIGICRHGDNQWILKLTSHSDLENILAKKDHVLEGSLMSVQLYDEREAKERLDPHRFILSGFSEDCKCSHLSVFIKSCSRGAEHSWEVLNDGQRIAVTFKQDIDVQDFLKKSSEKKLQSMDISASRLEYTDSVLVEGNMENITEKKLRDYFSSTKNNGGQIECLIWVKNAKSALLVFKDFHVAHRVVKEKHTICGVSLCALLFYCSLKQALTGETSTMPPFPPKISIPVDALFLECIQNDEECKKDFESTLKEHCTSISFKGDPDSPQVVLEMAVDRESLLLHRLAHTWERKTMQAVEALLEKYSIVTLLSTKEVWERIKDKCLSLNLKTARVSFVRAKNTIVVLGQKNDVKKLRGEIQLLLNKAKEELDVERTIPVNSREELGFVWNLVSEKLEGVEHLKDEVNLTFHLKGFEEKVNAAERIIKNTKDNLSIQTLHLSPNLTKFLQSLDLKKFERNHLTHISATVFSCGDSIQILAEKLQDGEKAREKIKEVLMEDVINLTPDQGKVTQEEHWRVFYSGLMQEVESSNNAENVKISHSDVQIAVCGFQNVVTDVARKLRGYLNNKMPVTEDILLKSLRQVEYVADCMKLSEAAEIKALDVTILSSRTQATPYLKVTAASDKIKEAVAVVKKRISYIVHEKHIYSNAGESKVLEKHQDALKARAKEFACKLFLTVEQASQTSLEKGYQSPDSTDTLSAPPANKSKKVAPLLPLPKPGADLKVVIGGITLILKKGDITKEAVDAIVNSTNSSLNLDTGVSGAILKAAGKSVQDECAKLGTQKGDGVVVTGGGNLKCKHIIQMVGPTTTAGITTSTERVLQLCESKSTTYVSIPAIGTGMGNIKPEESIKAILKGLQNHLSQTTSTSIKFVFIVAFEQKVFDLFRHYFAERNRQFQQRTEAVSGIHLPSIQSRSRELPANQVKIHGIRIEVKKGDITTETVRGIVNTTNKELNLKGGVSGAIFRAAGSSVEQECKKFGPQQDDGVVVTSGGALHCDFIIHMVGPRSLPAATSQVEKVLEQCEKNGITTVSFPAIGTGGGQLNAADVIAAMLQGFHNHLSQHISTVLKLIYIVVYEDKILQEFLQGLKQWSRPGLDNSCDEGTAAMSARRRPSSTSSDSSSSQTSSNIPTLSLGSASITFPVMVAEVYGVSVANLAQVKKCLDELVSEECTSQDVVDKHLHHLTEKEKQDIIEASQRHQVRIAMLQNKLTVSGKRDDVLSVILQIKDSLQRAQEREDQEREESRIWQTVRWEVGGSDSWTGLEQRINYNLELAFHRKDKLYIYQHQKDSFTVDFEKMQQTDSRGQITRIKRTPLSDCETAIITTPPTWTKMDGKDLDIIVLSEKSNEYQKICKEFVQSCQVFAQKNGKNIEVVQIQRIQHQEQWRRYTVSKQALDKKYPKNNNEQFLYHGTTKDICQKINKNGFNRSFCGRNATAFGSGTYFAKEAYYSCDDKYSNPDENGHKYMYRARVLTGKPCLGLHGMREPSPVDPNDLQAGLHDCAVNNLQNPSIFVIFSDSGAYPEYLITFKTVYCGWGGSTNEPISALNSLN